MATGLNAPLTTAVTLTPISSAAYNSNNNSMNTAVNPGFTNIGCDGVETFTAPTGGATATYQTFAPSDRSGHAWNTQVASPADALFFTDDLGVVAMQLTRNSGGMKLNGHGGFMQAWSRFTGAATGTYSHGLGTTPNHVMPMASVSGSQTMGYDSATSTQVHITSFAGLSFSALAVLL